MIRNRSKGSVIRSRARRGAAVVECAVVLPMLILITLGAITAGQFINVSQTVTDASREATRIASRITVLEESDVEAAVQSYFADAFPGMTADALNAGITVNVRDSLGAAVTGGDMTAIPSGSTYGVQVIFDFDTVAWISGYPLFGGRSIETTTMMRRE